MNKFCLAIFLSIAYYLLSTSPTLAVNPIFQPGGSLCSRTSSYQDRSNPGCYVTQSNTSTYNLYIPQAPRGQDENMSETCFTLSRNRQLSESGPTKPGYRLVTDSSTTSISTLNTQWPWDIPQEEDYNQLTLSGKVEQFIGDTFWKQGNTRTPTVPDSNMIVDQYGALEKLQPLLFQVKDRLDYCQLLETKQIFDEPVHYNLDSQNKTLLLSQICPAVPTSIRALDSNNLSDALSQWHQADPDMAEAFHQITPYIQQDQVAWMVVYMYRYDYNPIDGPRTILPDPIDHALIKLNLAGLSRATQAEHVIKDILVPQGLTPDTSIPQDFPITSITQLPILETQVLAAMKQLGYEAPQECNLPSPDDAEFEPGPPIGKGILAQIGQTVTNLTGVNFNSSDANLNTEYVGRCTPNDWSPVYNQLGQIVSWNCTTSIEALANVHLLNPEYLKDTCDEFYLSPGGSLRAHFPQSLIESQQTKGVKSDVPAPEEKPLLPTFTVSANAKISSPGKPNSPEVDLPTVCQGELARAKSLSLIGKALRPKQFVNQPQKNINIIYQQKKGLIQLLKNLYGLLTSKQ